MIALITTSALVLVGAVVALAVLPAVGGRREPDGWLSVQAPGPLARLARRSLGLHVRRATADVPQSRRAHRAPLNGGDLT